MNICMRPAVKKLWINHYNRIIYINIH
jgi:hypothetical protein